MATLIERINHTNGPRLYAVDVPSGISAERGVAFEPCIYADEAITFGCYKHGMENPALQQYFGGHHSG
ncbi:MAG: NAD(P)H-hydrate epimerase [Aerococcus sp.]|nr:NAD(P)H-hydrate epimerase [Aerococcus sp.]